MKRKPTTKQAVRAALVRLLNELLLSARTSNYQRTCDDDAARARGALLLAMEADIIDGATYSALAKLAVSAAYERSIELLYDQPPYTGAEFAKARRDAGKAAA